MYWLSVPTILHFLEILNEGYQIAELIGDEGHSVFGRMQHMNLNRWIGMRDSVAHPFLKLAQDLFHHSTDHCSHHCISTSKNLI
jgi:hypothetical protein